MWIESAVKSGAVLLGACLGAAISIERHLTTNEFAVTSLYITHDATHTKQENAQVQRMQETEHRATCHLHSDDDLPTHLSQVSHCLQTKQ